MKVKMLLGFASLSIAAFAAINTYKVQLYQDSVIEGKAFKAGEYKVLFENGNAVIKQGKDAVEVPAHEVMESSKVSSTELVYEDKTNLREIRVGGTSTRIVFEGASPMHAGS